MDEDSKKFSWLLPALLGVGIVAFGVYWTRFRPKPTTTLSSMERLDSTSHAVSPARDSSLPGLNESDALMRERISAAAPKAKLADWLGIDGIIRRMVAATAIIAEGKSPRDSLKFLKPERPFASSKKGAKIFLDPKGYARYDALADAFEAVDVEAATKLFAEFKPLFQQAYEELGGPRRDFQKTLIDAIAVFLRTPVVYGEIALAPKLLTFELQDPDLEALSPAQKHLLRAGPRNALMIQEKLRAFARALGALESQLPKTAPRGATPKLPPL